MIGTGELAAMKEHAEDWIASGVKHGKRAARNVLLLLAEVERLRAVIEEQWSKKPSCEHQMRPEQQTGHMVCELCNWCEDCDDYGWWPWTPGKAELTEGKE